MEQKKNTEIKQLYGPPATSQILRAARLARLEHVIRMSVNWWTKTMDIRGGVRNRREHPACKEGITRIGGWRDLAINSEMEKNNREILSHGPTLHLIVSFTVAFHRHSYF